MKIEPPACQLEERTAARYVLCMPRGCGLNDVLCQIWHSYQYAKAQNRILLVDTRVSGLADRLSRYMTPAQGWGSDMIELDDSHWAHLNQLSCYPKIAEGCLDLLPHIFLASLTADPNFVVGNRTRLGRQVLHLQRLWQYLHKPSKEHDPLRKLAFVFASLRMKVIKPDYRYYGPSEAAIVVHHCSGGGENSLHCLGLMRATQWLSHDIHQTIASLGDNFDAIHVRHTDYLSDYEPFIKSLKNQLIGRRVLVCSDNPHVIRYVQHELSGSEVFTFETTIGQTLCQPSGRQIPPRPAHYQWHLERTERVERNKRVFVDLFAMSRAKHLHYCSVSRNGWTGYSGFARLASNLAQHPDVRDTWLGTQNAAGHL